ncbi:MAG: hypothetical protein DI535_15785 [Citrobacter freundii]|nr:MAG: hypothetical protein DI535_15785 [Citrobacter freundii]
MIRAASSRSLNMKRIFTACLLLIAGTVSGQQPLQIPAGKLKEDHEILITALKELHPGIYRYQMPEQFAQLETKIRNRLTKSMTAEAYYRLTMPLIAGLHCGHTKWHRKDRPDDRYPFQQDDLFPLQLYFREGHAYVLRTYRETALLTPGTEITSINGKKIPDIIAQLRKYITIDGAVRSALYSELNQSFNGYYASFVETAPVYVIGYSRAGKNGKTQLAKVSMAEIRSVMERYQQEPRPAMELTIPRPGTAVLRIDRFYPGEGDPDYYKFIDSAFLSIREKGISKLIIDLRNNEGGVEEYGGYLYSYLATGPFVYYKKIKVARNTESSIKKYAGFPPGYEQALALIREENGEFIWPVQEYLAEKTPRLNAFAGKVMVLTNGFSFSVTAEFAAIAKTYNRATFIGEETGGSYEGDNSGVFAIVNLPNSGLSVSIPLMAFYMNTSAAHPRSAGIQPDVKVVAKIADVIAGRDVVMEKALEKE